MKVAVASGKGGTGKTTIAVALALAARRTEATRVTYVDCDVEAPNGALFLSPAIEHVEEVSMTVAEPKGDRCDGCGMCMEICAYGAVTVIGSTVMVFNEMCHGCGGCILACPKGALGNGRRSLGLVETGRAGGLGFVQGVMRVGEAMSAALIRRMKGMILGEEGLEGDGLFILDAPPGTSCPVVQTISGSDYVVLVTEPTRFGLHDLELAVGTVRALGIPCGVVVNSARGEKNLVSDWCRREGVEILMSIPFSRRIAEGYASGVPLTEAEPSLDLNSLLEKVSP